MDDGDSVFLEIDASEHIAFVASNGPDASDGRGHGETSRVTRRIALDRDVRAVVMTGSGRAFSVGATMERFAEVAGDPQMADQAMCEVRETVLSAVDCDTPVVCAINGPVHGSVLTSVPMAGVVEEQPASAEKERAR